MFLCVFESLDFDDIIDEAKRERERENIK